MMGCSTKEAKPVTVKGTVNLDKQPLKDGEILFVDLGGGGSTALPIKDGAFSGDIKPGKKKVEIRAFRPAKGDNTGGGMYKAGEVEASRGENFLPARYNTDSQTQEEIPASGKSDLTYEVTSR
jgi:hypothetical protein